MRSSITRRFRALFEELPAEIRAAAVKQYRLWQSNPRHPSLHFKAVGPELWSVRVTNAYRALALLRNHTFYWFWIGSHAEYDRIIGRK